MMNAPLKCSNLNLIIADNGDMFDEVKYTNFDHEYVIIADKISLLFQCKFKFRNKDC